MLKSSNLYSLLELKPITGRKHQLRKKLHFIGYPVVGDDKYFLKIDLILSPAIGGIIIGYEIGKLLNKETDSMQMFMSGKMKIEGDMTVAMKLSSIFG